VTTTTTLHPLAEDYLHRLDRATRRLPRGERRELTDEIVAHLAEATDPDMSDAEVLTVLDRLGDPEDIVEAEREDEPAPTERRGVREWAAIFLLLFGGFIFFVGWIGGLILLWSSRAWDTRDKLIGTLIVPGGLATAFVVLILTSTTQLCSSGPGRPTHCTPGPSTLSNVVGIALIVLCSLGPICTAFYLARRAR
jgi:hypothetical protein